MPEANEAIRGLIFDLDGLILDTEGPDFQTWQEVFNEHGFDLPFSVWAPFIGAAPDVADPLGYLEEQLGRSVDREAVHRRHRQLYLELAARQPMLPGVSELIADARNAGLKLGLASSSPREWVLSHLSRLGLVHQFDCIKTGDDVASAKPDPELYLAALETLALGPEEAVALEDSPHGLMAAKKAGLFCVVVPNPLTAQLSLELADLRLASLADTSLEKLLQEVRSTRLTQGSAS